MPVYKKEELANGRITYFKDGKRFPASQIPEQILARLQVPAPVVEVSDGQPSSEVPVEPEAPRPPKKCIFCGKKGTNERVVHLQTVYLCDKDYGSHTLGQVGARVKELQDAEEGKNQAKEDA